MTPAQSPLVTITLNPALDLSAEVARVVPGPKLRTGPVLAEAGGGGINVARAAAALGGQVTALACLGGATGHRLARLVAAVPGLTLHPLPAPDETRESLSITEADTGAQFRFVLPGPVFGLHETDELLGALVAALLPGAVVVLSGSQPPGLPDDLPQRLARALPPGARLVVDTSGAPLDRLLTQPDPAALPWLLRLDESEVRARAGGAPEADFARALVASGHAAAVAVACGARGDVLAAEGAAWACTPPPVPVVSKVGAGDSFVGACALALARGQGWAEALRQGTAAAAAAVITPGTELCRPDDVARIAARCTLAPA
jgi:6-phosphofructokinase 2